MPRRNKTPTLIPRLYRRHCDTKRRFDSEKKAQDAAEFRMLENMTITIEVYQCQDCRGWHLTSKR